MSDCEYYKDGACEVATRLAGVVAPVREDACAACLKSKCPKTDNNVTVSVAVQALRLYKIDTRLFIRQYRYLLEVQCESAVGNWNCGDLLHDALLKIGFDYGPDCECKKWVQKMNLYGPVWSADKKQLIAQSMVDEAKKRNVVSFISLEDAAILLIEDAISRCTEVGNKI